MRPSPGTPVAPAAPPPPMQPRDAVMRIPLDQIVPSPLQPRKEFEPEQLRELMDSIREHGIIQPLIVREVGGKLELIAGERRFRASRELGLKEVPVITRDASDRDVLEMALPACPIHLLDCLPACLPAACQSMCMAACLPFIPVPVCLSACPTPCSFFPCPVLSL